MRVYASIIWVILAALICQFSSPNHAVSESRNAIVGDQMNRTSAFKSVPAQLSYQGFLADATDSSAVTATPEMTFRLFDSETEGTELWSEIHTMVEVRNGLFHVLLGSVTTFPDGLFDGSTLWLQTEVGPEILAPRKPLISTAYSHRANSAEMLLDNTLTDLDDRWVNEEDLDHLDAADGDPAEAVYVDNAGKVGVGTTSPLTELDVNGSVNAATYYGDGSNLTGITGTPDADWTISGNHMYSAVPGSVGVGTSSPENKFHVAGDVKATTYYGDGSNLTGISGTTDNDWTISGDDVYHEVGNVGIGTTNPTLGRLEALASSGTGVYGASSSGIGIFGYSTTGQGVVGNSTTGHAGYFLGNVYSSANVGVGTETPERQLHIKGVNPRILIEASSVSPEVNFRNSDDTGPETWALYKHGTTDDFRFYQNGDKLTIKNSTGYVGIGTTDPISQLHIKEPSFPTYLTIESETGYAPGILLNVNGTIEWRMFYHPTEAMLSFYREGIGDKLVIKNNGDVGIGTSNPSYPMHVVDTTPSDDTPAIYGEHAVTDHYGVGVKGVGLFKGVEGVVSGSGDEKYYGVYGEASSSSGGAAIAYGVYGKVIEGGNFNYGVYGTTGQNTGVYGECTSRLSHGWLGSWYRGVFGKNDIIGSAGVEGQSDYGHAVHGYSPSGYAGYFSGDVHITGSLTGGKGSCTIDHPLDPENKLLRNNYVESPECLLIYRGKIRLDDTGRAAVEMPEYFAALTNEADATVHLTPIGRSISSERHEFYYEWQTGQTNFDIYGEPNREVAWMVMAERDDPVFKQLAQPIEEEKGSQSKICDRGELLYPEAYGRPQELGKDYRRLEEISQREKMPPGASKKSTKQ